MLVRSQTNKEPRREFSVLLSQSQVHDTEVDPDRHPDTDKTHTRLHELNRTLCDKVVLGRQGLCGWWGLQWGLPRDGLDTCTKRGVVLASG